MPRNHVLLNRVASFPVTAYTFTTGPTVENIGSTRIRLPLLDVHQIVAVFVTCRAETAELEFLLEDPGRPRPIEDCVLLLISRNINLRVVDLGSLHPNLGAVDQDGGQVLVDAVVDGPQVIILPKEISVFLVKVEQLVEYLGVFISQNAHVGVNFDIFRRETVSHRLQSRDLILLLFLGA